MKSVAAITIAGIFALAAFVVAIIAGLAGGNPTAAILQRAIICMLVCYPVGLAIGLLAERIIQDHIQVHQDANPAPDSGTEPLVAQPAPIDAGDEEVLVV